MYSLSRKWFDQRKVTEDLFVHVASLLDLLHLKHAELAKLFPRYMGGVVLRRQRQGRQKALFTEQGVASHMAAVQFLDFLVRQKKHKSP